MSESELRSAIKNGKGSAKLRTVTGDNLTVREDGSQLVLRDAHGDESLITKTYAGQSNGVVYLIDTVLKP